MAYWCIDPVSGNDGTGSSQTTQAAAELTPFQNWSAITWNAGDTYLQKVGTTYTSGIVVGVNGTAGNIVTMGIYGGSGYAYVSNSAGNAITANGKEYVEISGYDVTAPNNTGIVIFCSDIRSAVGCKISHCRAHGCGSGGIAITPIPGRSSYKAITDATIEECISYDNGGHGVAMVGALTPSCIIKDSTAYNNGLSSNTWGIYMSSRSSKYTGTAWTVVAGTVYQMDFTASALQTGEVLTQVAAPGRTGGGATNEIFLTNGTFGSLNPGEWAQSGDNVQIDIGENPDGLSVIFESAENTGGIIENCTSYGHTDTVADGNGIGFDHMMQNGIIRACKSYNNDNTGISFNVCRNCTQHSNEVYGNAYGIRINSTSAQADTDCYSYNNYIHDNTTGMYVIRAPKATLNGNAVESNTTNFTIGAESTGVTYGDNNYHNNTTTQNTDASDTTDNPLRNADGTLPANSPLIGTGSKFWSGANPISFTGEPYSDFDTDRGHIQSTYSPFHSVNL